jgi:hypothetical protein
MIFETEFFEHLSTQFCLQKFDFYGKQISMLPVTVNRTRTHPANFGVPAPGKVLLGSAARLLVSDAPLGQNGDGPPGSVPINAHGDWKPV